MVSSRQRTSRVGGILATVGLVLAAAGVVAGPASAAQPTPAPITDYATYPQPGIFPEGCTEISADLVLDPRFEVTGGPASGTYANLRNINGNLQPGDVITMTWGGFAPGCEAAGVSMSIKESDTPVFDRTVDQRLINTPQQYDACGPGGVPCTQGASGRWGPLVVTIPTRTVTCAFQLDAAVGPALALIGPNGSFYSAGLRADGGPNLLVSAYNGGFPCPGTMVVDKQWVLDGVLGEEPPADLPPGFTITVRSLSNLGAELGRATSTDGGVTFTYANASGNTGALDIVEDGSIEVDESPALAGSESTSTTTCVDDACTVAIVNSVTTTVPPTTVPPTTVPPTTLPPTTAPPSVLPTTVVNTTLPPTTLAPTTAPPSVLPTTVVNTTVRPTTVAPRTTAPGRLPRTGAEPGTLLVVGAALLVLGATALIWSRRGEIDLR